MAFLSASGTPKDLEIQNCKYSLQSIRFVMALTNQAMSRAMRILRMPTKAKKTATKTALRFSSPTNRILFLALVVLLRSPGPLIADQSTVIHQSFYYFESKHDAENAKMDTIEAETVQKQLEIRGAAAEAQRHDVDDQDKNSAARLDALRQEAELLKSGANAYHLDNMSSTKKPLL